METELFSNKTDFFTRIAPLLTGGLNLTITLKRVGDQITVATRPQRPDVKDKNDVLSKIQPLVITETADALDSGYIETITQAAEPVNSIAEGLKEFNKGLDAAKTAAAKKSTSKSSSKPKAAAKTKAPSKPKLSADQIAEKKKKEADAKKASAIKGLEQKLSSASGAFSTNKFTAAEQAITAGLKLWKDKKYEAVDGDTDYGLRFTELGERVKKAKADKEREENMKKAAKPLSDARKYFTAMNMLEGAKNLKLVYKLVPDHPGALELTKEIVEKFNQTVYDQLM